MLWRSPPTARRPAGFVAPCLPTLTHAVPAGPLWADDIKHDGYRFIVRRDGDRVRAFTRRGYDWTDPVPAIAEGLLALSTITLATIDGKAVVCGPEGVDRPLSLGTLSDWIKGKNPNAPAATRVQGCWACPWTLELLADQLVRLTEHARLSRETVRRRLAENELKP